jgi:hypothetical protein
MEAMRKAGFLVFLLLVLTGCAGVINAAQRSQPTPKASSTKGRAAQNRPDQGSVSSGVYTEKFFNLSYALPEGWVEKTASIREGLASGENGILLLSAFARETPGPGEIIPSVTISAENAASFPQAKSADDYFDSLSQVATGNGFAVLNPPAQIDMGGVTFVRGDFRKEQGDKTGYQASMVALRKGYFLTITAISENEEDLTSLLSRLRTFAPPTLNRH